MPDNIKCFYVFGMLISLCFGCSSKQNYYQTVKHGIETVPHVQEIKQVFPKIPVDHFISMYGHNRNKPVSWYSQIFFGGRYTFTYRVDVLIDYKNNKVIKAVSKPEIIIEESREIYSASPTTVGSKYDDGYELSETDWNKVVAAGGDFSVIGINLKTNAALPRFQEFVNAIRVGREVIVDNR